MSEVLLPPLAVAGATLFQLVDPGGVVRDLSDNANVNVLADGVKGLGFWWPDLIADKLPTVSGEILRRGSVPARRISLPIEFSASTEPLLQVLMDSVYGWFATADEATNSPAYLRVTRPDDAVRQIAVYYAGGLEGDLTLERAADTWQEATVELYAPDPWPTDVTETEASYDESDVGATLSVINTGDFEAYPIWTVEGPASAITLSNLTTEVSFALTADGGLTLAAGDVLTIDTRPGSSRPSSLQVYDQDASNYFRVIAPGGDLWTLAAGQNRFTIAATGTSGATAFTLSWLPRYRGILR